MFNFLMLVATLSLKGFNTMKVIKFRYKHQLKQDN